MSRKTSQREFWDSAKMNNSTFRMYFDRLVGIAISMFEWHNLPKTVDPRFLELALFTEGKAIFFRDEVMGELALKFMSIGELNIYQIPTRRRAFAVNGYNKELDDTNSVIIWNNVLHTNSFNEMEISAMRLYDIQRTIDTNIKAQKTPVMIIGTEEERLSLKQLYMKYEGNEPFIFGDKDLNTDKMRAIQTQAPYVADVLFNAKKEIWNEALSSLGVPVTDRVKRERLLAAEIAGDKASSVAQQFIRLSTREKACEEINDMFGLNIGVTYRRLDDMALLDYELSVEEGAGENVATKAVNDIGKIYNRG